MFICEIVIREFSMHTDVHYLFLGPLSDILQMLLVCLFDLQDEEEDEIKHTDIQTTGIHNIFVILK